MIPFDRFIRCRTARVWLAWFWFVALSATASAALVHVRDHGAIGDGLAKETASIARAIDACAKAGGGVVDFPAGRYLTSTIELKSNVTLHVGPGATILGSPDVVDYPLIPNPWSEEAQPSPTQLAPLIYASGAENNALVGPGTIDGQGLIWWKRYWLAGTVRVTGQV